MKNKYLKFGLATVVAFSMCIGAVTGDLIKTKIAKAAGTEPGSSSDPVVSKSYVDYQISELKRTINNLNINSNTSSGTTNSNSSTVINTIDEKTKQSIVDEAVVVMQALYGDKLDSLSNNNLSNNTSNTDEDSQGAFVPVKLEKGQILIGGEGAEIIFRSGAATAYSENEMGVIDVSSGTELFNGDKLLPNHLLIIGRNDGRGAKSSSESWFTVKGTYRIKK